MANLQISNLPGKKNAAWPIKSHGMVDVSVWTVVCTPANGISNEDHFLCSGKF